MIRILKKMDKKEPTLDLYLETNSDGKILLCGIDEEGLSWTLCSITEHGIGLFSDNNCEAIACDGMGYIKTFKNT